MVDGTAAQHQTTTNLELLEKARNSWAAVQSARERMEKEKSPAPMRDCVSARTDAINATAALPLPYVVQAALEGGDDGA